MDMNLLQRIFDLVEKTEQNLILCRDHLSGCLQGIERRKQEAILEDIHQLFDIHEAPESDVFCEIAVQIENNHKVFDDFVHGDDMGSITSNQNVEVLDAHYVFDKMPVRQITRAWTVPRISALNHSFEMVAIWPISKGIWPTGVGTQDSSRGGEIKDVYIMPANVSKVLLSDLHGYNVCAYKVLDDMSKRTLSTQFEVVEIETILQEHNNAMAVYEILVALAHKFSESAEQRGKMVVQMNPGWNRFQIRHYAVRAKSSKALGKLTVTLVHWDDSIATRNVSQLRATHIVTSALITPSVSAARKDAPENYVMEFEAKSMKEGAWYGVTIFISLKALDTGDSEVLVLSLIVIYLISFTACLYVRYHSCPQNVVVWYYGRATWPTGIGTILSRSKLLVCGKILLGENGDDVILMMVEFFISFAHFQFDLDGFNGVFPAHLFVWLWLVESKEVINMEIEVCYQNDLVTAEPNEESDILETNGFGVVKPHGSYMMLYKISTRTIVVKIELFVPGMDVVTLVIIVENFKSNVVVIERKIGSELNVGSSKLMNEMKLVLVYKVLEVETKGNESRDHLFKMKLVLVLKLSSQLQWDPGKCWSYVQHVFISKKMSYGRWHKKWYWLSYHNLGGKVGLYENGKRVYTVIEKTVIPYLRGHPSVDYNVASLKMVQLLSDKMLLFLLTIVGTDDFRIIMRNVNASSFISYSHRVNSEMKELSRNPSVDIGGKAWLTILRNIRSCARFWVTIQSSTWVQSKVWIIAWSQLVSHVITNDLFREAFGLNGSKVMGFTRKLGVEKATLNVRKLVDNFSFLKMKLASDSCPYLASCRTVNCLILEDKDYFKLGVLIRSKLYGLSPVILGVSINQIKGPTHVNMGIIVIWLD